MLGNLVVKSAAVGLGFTKSVACSSILINGIAAGMKDVDDISRIAVYCKKNLKQQKRKNNKRK